LIDEFDIAARDFAITFPRTASILRALREEYNYRAERGW
jgi:hypothetical protein